jgi:putative transposase
MGRSAVRWARPSAGTLQTVTVARAADGWSVCCSCATVPGEPWPVPGRETGLDVGLTGFLITADGEGIPNPRHSRPAAKRRATAQRRVARRKQGSTRRKQAVHLLKRTQQHVQRQRRDLHQKTALALVRQYGTIYVEAIQPANLSRRPEPKSDGHGGYAHNGASRKAGLNKSIQDAGWRHFLSILAYIAACAGRRVETVNPAYTSQDCSGCGERIQKALSVRTHGCTNCGLVLNRDANAARNILWLGQRLRGVLAVAGAMNREPAGL